MISSNYSVQNSHKSSSFTYTDLCCQNKTAQTRERIENASPKQNEQVRCFFRPTCVPNAGVRHHLHTARGNVDANDSTETRALQPQQSWGSRPLLDRTTSPRSGPLSSGTKHIFLDLGKHRWARSRGNHGMAKAIQSQPNRLSPLVVQKKQGKKGPNMDAPLVPMRSRCPNAGDRDRHNIKRPLMPCL